ncbi:MAG: hypothetical protein NTZ73_03095 [Candidatus Diapherotrites archaeon]|nr:hypothetical protein [Candidatus Diapherotrites archaeon]
MFRRRKYYTVGPNGKKRRLRYWWENTKDFFRKAFSQQSPKAPRRK